MTGALVLAVIAVYTVGAVVVIRWSDHRDRARFLALMSFTSSRAEAASSRQLPRREAFPQASGPAPTPVDAADRMQPASTGPIPGQGRCAGDTCPGRCHAAPLPQVWGTCPQCTTTASCSAEQWCSKNDVEDPSASLDLPDRCDGYPPYSSRRPAPTPAGRL